MNVIIVIFMYTLLEYEETDLLQQAALEFNTQAKIQNPPRE